MADIIKARGYDFLPLGFELSGAPGSGWAIFLKKTSEIAHARRGHNRAAFTRYWKSRIAMAIAKRGARAALDKARELAATSVPGAGATTDAGPLSGAEPPTVWEEGNHAPLGRVLSRAPCAEGESSAGGG